MTRLKSQAETNLFGFGGAAPRETISPFRPRVFPQARKWRAVSWTAVAERERRHRFQAGIWQITATLAHRVAGRCSVRAVVVNLNAWVGNGGRLQRPAGRGLPALPVAPIIIRKWYDTCTCTSVVYPAVFSVSPEGTWPRENINRFTSGEMLPEAKLVGGQHDGVWKARV